MKNTPAMLIADFYKVSHRKLYPENTETIFSTWTCRGSRMDGVNEIIVFGFQGFIKKYLIEYFNDNFFSKNIDDIVKEYSRIIKFTLGEKNPDVEHIIALHSLGYLPLEIKTLPEGTLCPIRIPCMTVKNTLPQFFWLTNFIETLLSAEVWQPITSATIAYQYRRLLDSWAEKTCDDNNYVDFQAHDFSFRGMPSVESAQTSGAGHLLSFTGTDTIPAITYLENYYNANIENELVGTSIPATEHSVACANGLDEYETFKRIITEVHPNGFVSIVSDTWNLWDVLTKTIPALKDDIMNRDGKVVIRPDSGNPVDIICGEQIEGSGNLDYEKYYIERKKGVIELLWDAFGGTINSKGYKILDSHIGAIYGDAITLERAEEICHRLEAKGFASSNIVFGVGSFTYTYNTRDTFGQALKSTYAVINGEEKLLFKDPITDDGLKKSQKGLVVVIKNGNNLELVDNLNEVEYNKLDKQFNANQMETVFLNGNMIKEYSLTEIRNRLKEININE